MYVMGDLNMIFLNQMCISQLVPYLMCWPLAMCIQSLPCQTSNRFIVWLNRPHPHKWVWYWCFTSPKYTMLIYFRPLVNFQVADDGVTNYSNMINTTVSRGMCHKNLLKFVNEMKELNWQCVIKMTRNMPIVNSMKLYPSSIKFVSHTINLQNASYEWTMFINSTQTIKKTKNELFVIQKKQNKKREGNISQEI